MITLIHGDDIAASRNYLFELKQKFPENTAVNGITVTLEDLQQALSGNDLFGDAKTIVIEDLLSKHRSLNELDTLLALITPTSQNVILWESKEVSKKNLQGFKNAAIKEFKIPSTIFALLDAVRSNNGKQLIELFHKTLVDKDPEFVLIMLQRQVRILLALQSANGLQTSAVDSSQNAISEITRLAPWQKGKLGKQASLFTQDQLVSLHKRLFDLELGMKTGNLAQSLENEIDFFLLSL